MTNPEIEIYIDKYGNKSWWMNGEPHRADGPAVEFSNGYKCWWYNGVQIHCKTQEEFERIMALELFW